MELPDMLNFSDIVREQNAMMANLKPVWSDMYSDAQFEKLKRYIQAFESHLDPDHEVGLMFTNFGESVTMQVTDINYEEPVLMIFRGYVNGAMSTLIQHVTQLNFLLTSVPKEPDRPKRPIGFAVEG